MIIPRDSPALSTISLRGMNLDSDHLHQTQSQHGHANTRNQQARRPAAVSTSSNFSIKKETIPQSIGSNKQDPTRLVNLYLLSSPSYDHNRYMPRPASHTHFVLAPTPLSHTPRVSLQPRRHLTALRVYNTMRHTSLSTPAQVQRASV
jgi:hypothetical protein